MREFVDKQAVIDDLKRQCREVFRIDAVKPEDYYIKKNAKFMEDTWTNWCEGFYKYLGARTAFTEQEIVKPYLERLVNEMQKLRGCSCSNSDGIIDEIEDIVDKILSEQLKGDEE